MNELSSFRNAFVPFDSYTVQFTVRDIARIEREAEQMRAEQVARHVAAVGGAVWRAVKWAATGVLDFFVLLSRASSAQETYEALSRLSDRQLEDIGLTRQDVPARVLEVLGGTIKRSQATTADLHAVAGGRPRESAKPKHETPRRRAA